MGSSASHALHDQAPSLPCNKRHKPGIAPGSSFGFDLSPLPISFDFVSHEVPPSCVAARKVLDLVQASIPNARLVSLRRFGSPWLWQKFQQCSEEVARQNRGISNTRMLFHGAREPQQILGTGLAANSEGFDFRLSSGGQYGHGSYFAA